MRTLRAVVDSGRIPVAEPYINPDRSVIWPWSLSRTERRADKDCCRGETLNIELLEHVLDARNGESGVTRRKKKSK